MGVFPHLRARIYWPKRSMINIASLYYFTLLQRLSPKYKESLSSVMKRIHSYLKEEWIEYSQKKKILGEYETLIIKLEWIWEIYLFQRMKYSYKLYYLPSFFSEIYIERKYIRSAEKKKKMIFLLSNIFECFDEFEEKNMLIEFHNDLEVTKNNEKTYFLRHDFIDINSLSELYSKRNLKWELQDFAERCKKQYLPSEIKNKYPEVYRSLLFLVYNVFAIHKSLKSTQEQLKEVQSFQKSNISNAHISLSQERLRINKVSLEEVLPVYKASFEHFMHIISGRKI